MCKIPLLIGKCSNNQPSVADLNALRHLFVSYSERRQFSKFLKHALVHLKEHNERFGIVLASSEATAQEVRQIILQHDLKFAYIKSKGEMNTGSREGFMKAIVKELKHRERSGTIPQFHEPLLVVAEDVFDLFASAGKNIAFHFIKLLVHGPAVNIHLIAGSIRTYLNLMRQLSTLSIHPRMQHMFAASDLQQSFAAELIINPEDLYFFKQTSESAYRRLFEMSEGVHNKMLNNTY